MSDTIRLSPEGRNALRRAITNHAQWDSVRKSNNYSLATMSRDDYFAVANILKLDVRTIVDNANANAPQNPKAEKAREVFDNAPVAPRPLPEGISVGPREETPRFGHDNKTSEEITELDNLAKRQREEMLQEHKAPKMNGHAHPEMPNGAAGKLMALIAEIAGSSVNPEQVKEIVRAEIEKAVTDLGRGTVRIELERQGVKIGTVDGHTHPEFPDLLRACSARDVSGYVLNCWLAGPAGSGKTHAAKTVAKALGLAFHYNGAIGMAYELLGFTDANGCYHRTPFREAYEKGGVYLFDEVDGSDNAALLALNAALANNVATFPDGQVERHKDCIIIAAANTWGFGGTSDYVGRSKIDAAFLSRFPARFDWQYDEELERNICGNPEFAEVVQAARAKAKSAGLKVLITPRDSIAGAALVAAGFTKRQAAERTFLANLSADQKRMVS